MAIETITEHGEPEPERQPAAERDNPNLPAHAGTGQAAHADAVLRAFATATINRLLDEHPAVSKAIKDALRARVHLRELAGRSSHAEAVSADAEQHESNLSV